MKNIDKFLGSLLIFGIGFQIDSYAASIANNVAVDNLVGKTSTNVKFTANNQIITPVDPSNPNTASNSGDSGNGAKSGGGLSLIYVSKKLDFGSHEINVVNPKTYTPIVKYSSLWNDAFVIEVSDVRGTTAGWTLSVSGNDLMDNEGDKIKGATLALPLGSVANSGYASNGVASHASKNVLNSKMNDVLDADINKGSGVTIDQLYPGNIKLVIPSNTTEAKSYTTILNWSLADTPES